MVKQCDQGDLLEIYFEKERDTIKKFQKVIRKVLVSEKKDIVIDMASAPEVPSNFLASLVFGAKALRSHGHTVTLILSPTNYSLLRKSPDVQYFKLEIGQVISDEEIEEFQKEFEKKEIKIPYFKLEDNVLIISDEESEKIPTDLPDILEKLSKENFESIVIDLTQLFLITPEIINTLIVESLKYGDLLKIRILESMKEIIEANPQSMLLNLEVIKEFEEEGKEDIEESLKIEEERGEESLETEEESLKEESLEREEKKEKEETDDEAFKLDFESEELIVEEEKKEKEVKLKEKNKEPSKIDEKEGFKIEVNVLKIGKVSKETFFEKFPVYFERLFNCGNKIYVDMSDYGVLENDIIQELFLANFKALNNNKTLIIRLLKEQQEEFLKYLPQTEKVEKKDTTPRFTIIGSRMELYNVDIPLFLEKFPEYFKELMATGHKDLVVDVSHLKEFPPPAIELMVACYLEAVGRGLSLTLRIRPEMEEGFQKSGRGRALPLEVVKPELKKKINTLSSKSTKPFIDMKKIKEAIEKDKLTAKVKEKQFEALHIESRGKFENWEPSPIKGDTKKERYTGIERRKDKRYETDELEIIFARGSLAKIGGRRYPVNNISQGGICFTCAVSLSRNEYLRMRIYGEDVSVEVGGRVVWVKPVPSQALFRVGVEFTKLSEVAKAQIRSIIAKIYKSR